MGQLITLTELVLILIICIPVYAMGKTIIETIKDNSNNNQ
jgi:hypothetical protein